MLTGALLLGAKFAAAILGLYLLVLLAAWAVQRRFIYPGVIFSRRAQPGVVPNGYRLVALETEDGLSLQAAWRAPQPGMPVAVFFHGNGSSMRHAGYPVAALARAGFGVLLPEYRGYGGNPGKPSEAGLYMDGAAALAWLHARGVSPDNIVLIGNSIGSGVATELAARLRPKALVLISPFARLADVAQRIVKWAPARFMLRDRYDNIGKIGRVHAPVLIVHGGRDRLIPFDHARALASNHANTRLVRFPDYGHELAWRPDVGEVIVGWLSEGARVRYRQGNGA